MYFVKGLVVMQTNHHFSKILLHNIYRSQKSKYWIGEHCKKAMFLTVVMKMKEMLSISQIACFVLMGMKRLGPCWESFENFC
jgi:hypothetical protein